MALSGLIVLAFVVFHILHFTTRSVNPELRASELGGKLLTEYDVHSMVIRGFQNHPLITGFYLLGLFLLAPASEPRLLVPAPNVRPQL